MTVHAPTPHISTLPPPKLPPAAMTCRPRLDRPPRDWDEQKGRTYLIWLAGHGGAGIAHALARRHGITFNRETLYRYRSGGGSLASFAALMLRSGS